MKRKILSLILVFAMTVSLLTVGTGAVEPTYGDTAGHWAESSIERWSGHGIIQGSNGQFDPNGQLTCAQLATILAKLLKLPAAKDAGFTDNTADAWYYDAINRCAAAGILNGNGDGTVTPEAPITRERAMVMLARALGIEPIEKPDLTKFSDAAKVASYAQGYVAALIEAGIVGGVTADELAPQDNINRASTVTILDRAISTYADKAGETVNADGKGIVLVVAENVKITGAPEGTKIVVADGATGLTVNGKSVSDDQTYIVPKTTTGSGSSSGGYSHTHNYDATTHKCSCGQADPAYAVASVSGKNYLTLSEAITAAQAGNKTMTLAADKTTTESIQAILDGQHGSIDGLTIELPSGTYDKLELARVVAETKDGLTYTCNHTDGTHYTFTDVDKYKSHLAENVFHFTNTYTRTMSGVKLVANGDVTINGLLSESGHLHQKANPFRDGQGYYFNQKLTNFTFEGIKFVGNVDINTSSTDTEISDFTFKNCSFTTNGMTSDKGQAIRYYNENNNGKVSDLKVINCTFNNCYQGVYTMKIKNVSVTGSSFDTTGHNAIAVQGEYCNHGVVQITGNTFANIGDRIIRFNKVGADTQITITNNTATNSGDSNGEVIKANSLADGVTCDISNNNWGNGTVNIPSDRPEMSAQIGEAQYETLAAAIAAAQSGDTIKLLANVVLPCPVAVDNSMTLDLAGHSITPAGQYASSTEDGKNKDYLLGVKYGGNLTVKDSSADKTGVIRSGDVMCGIKMTIYGETRSDNKTANFTLESGKIEGKAYGISGNGTRQGTVITINGGSVTATSGVAIYQPQMGELTITGGELTASTAVVVKSGSLTVTGGTISGTGAHADYTHNGNGWNSTGDGLAVEACNYPGGVVSSVNISGGVFESANGKSVAYYKQATYALTNEKFITGGTFSSDPSEYVAAGYKTEESDGNYTVRKMNWDEYPADGTLMPAGVKIEDRKEGDGENGKTFTITLEDEEAFLYFTQIFDRAEAFEARKTGLENGSITRFEHEYTWPSLNMWYGPYCSRITVKLACNVDLGGMEIKPFGMSGYVFNFDGDGHTIKNAEISKNSGDVGFFQSRANVSNVVFDGIQVTAAGCGSAGVVAGSPNSNITNVTVKNCSVTGAKYTGAIAGYDYGDITNCKVENTVISGQYKVGGIVGYVCTDNAAQQRNITGNTLTDVTVKGENLWSGKNDFVIGKIVGNWNAITGTCTGNIFDGATDPNGAIGEIESRCTNVVTSQQTT